MARVTTDDLLEAIDALGKEQPKLPPGDGWQTMAQMAKAKGIRVGAMRFRFSLALERGLKVERFVGSAPDETGRLVKQTWFRVKR